MSVFNVEEKQVDSTTRNPEVMVKTRLHWLEVQPLGIDLRLRMQHLRLTTQQEQLEQVEWYGARLGNASERCSC